MTQPGLAARDTKYYPRLREAGLFEQFKREEIAYRSRYPKPCDKNKFLAYNKTIARYFPKGEYADLVDPVSKKKYPIIVNRVIPSEELDSEIPAKALLWVFVNWNNSAVRESECPPGAWDLRAWLKNNVENRDAFYNKYILSTVGKTGRGAEEAKSSAKQRKAAKGSGNKELDLVMEAALAAGEGAA